MAGTLQMKIVTPAGTRFDGEVLHAAFPGTLGEFAVFPAHAPLISTLKKGTLKYATPDDPACTLSIESGFVEVDNNMITVCTE